MDDEGRIIHNEYLHWMARLTEPGGLERFRAVDLVYQDHSHHQDSVLLSALETLLSQETSELRAFHVRAAIATLKEPVESPIFDPPL